MKPAELQRMSRHAPYKERVWVWKDIQEREDDIARSTKAEKSLLSPPL